MGARLRASRCCLITATEDEWCMMANMAYCRFQNTLKDLRDCQNAMWDEAVGEMEKDERKARLRLIKLCREIADEFEDELES